MVQKLNSVRVGKRRELEPTSNINCDLKKIVLIKLKTQILTKLKRSSPCKFFFVGGGGLLLETVNLPCFHNSVTVTVGVTAVGNDLKLSTIINIGSTTIL